MEDKQETALKLSNGTSLNDIELPLIQLENGAIRWIICNFLLVSHCKYSSMLYHFHVIWHWIIMTLKSSLRSASSSRYKQPQMRLKFGQHGFSYATHEHNTAQGSGVWSTDSLVKRWRAVGNRERRVRRDYRTHNKCKCTVIAVIHYSDHSAAQ